MQEANTPKRDNNKITLTSDQFIEIIEGRNIHYIYYSSNQKAGAEMSFNEAKEKGFDPEPDPVQIPETWYRNKFEEKYSTVPLEYRPDRSRPMTYEVNGNISMYNLYNKKNNSTNDASLIRGINISNCNFQNSIAFDKVNSSSYIKFNNCNFFQKGFPDENTNVSSLRFNKCSFTEVHFSNIASENLETRNSLQHLHIDSLKTNLLSISDSHIEELTIDTTNSEIKQLIIKNSIVNKIILKGNYIEECIITNISCSNSFTINTSFKKIAIAQDSTDNQSIATLNIECLSQTDKGFLIIGQKVFIKNLLIMGINNGDIVIKETKIEDIKFTNFTNIGSIKLHKVKDLKNLFIEDVSMGNLELMDIDLSSANEVKFTGSTISDMVLNNTVFPTDIKASHENDFDGVRENFRQLKYAANKQGNRIKELEYEALEMQAYTKNLSAHSTRFDRFILWSNEWSNNHGLDAEKAIKKLIYFTLSLYIVVKLCQGSKLDITYTFATISEYLNFSLNPLHDYDKVFSQNVSNTENQIANGVARLLDSIARLLSGYFIFQFLKAFRKFAKS